MTRQYSDQGYHAEVRAREASAAPAALFKRLYDRLRDGHARPVREHFYAGLDYQNKLARFLENHDEPRATTGVMGSSLGGVVSFYMGRLAVAGVPNPTAICAPVNFNLLLIAKSFVRNVMQITDTSYKRVYL